MTRSKRFASTGVPSFLGKNEDPLIELSKKIRQIHQKEGTIDISLLRSLLMLKFNVDFSWNFYRLRYSENQLLYFSLSDTEIYYENLEDENALVGNVVLIFDDASLNTSLQLKVGARDFNELMVPVTMPSEKIIKLDKPPSR